MNKLKLVSALIISLSIGIIYAKDIQNINDQAEEIIYLYAEIIDSKNFSELKSIMQTNFKMTGMYEINSLEEFMFAMQELDMKLLNNITWQKPNPPPNLACRYFTHSTETVIWASKNQKSKHIFNYDLMKEIKPYLLDKDCMIKDNIVS